MMFSEKKVIQRLDKMLDDGINGTFEESEYDETALSKLESKWLRFLTSSKLSYQKTSDEKEKLAELISDISHQTKTPLANILLYTQLLEEKNLDEECCTLVEEISRQSKKLDFLIQSLVKTSRLETGTFQMTSLPGNLDTMIAAAIEQILPYTESKGIRVTYEPESQNAVFDSKWTQEALFNILDNAVKYSPENSEVTVKVEPYEMFSCIMVSDKGIGIADDEKPAVFGRFYRGRNVKDRKGVGIGLYLARQIIEEQGGYITVESAIPKGSVFRIYLPR